MREVSRREWADLRFAHPCPDLTDPDDEFAVHLIAATHDLTVDEARAVWEGGTETEALTAYQTALRLGQPDHTWAKGLLHTDGRLAIEMRICLAAGISHDEFLSWSDRAQDLAVQAWIDEHTTCPRCGASAAAMTNPELADIKVETCWVCHVKNPHEKALAESGEGGHKRLVVVPK